MTVRLLTATAVAELLDVDRSTVYRLVREERMPAPITIYGQRRWREDEITAHIEEATAQRS